MLIDIEGVGMRIKHHRSLRGLSQEQLGNLTLTKTQHISNIETGRKLPSLELLVSIANALHVSADDLLVDSLEESSAQTGDDIHKLLLDCSDIEKKIIVRTLSSLKAALSEFGI